MGGFFLAGSDLTALGVRSFAGLTGDDACPTLGHRLRAMANLADLSGRISLAQLTVRDNGSSFDSPPLSYRFISSQLFDTRFTLVRRVY